MLPIDGVAMPGMHTTKRIILGQHTKNIKTKCQSMCGCEVTWKLKAVGSREGTCPGASIVGDANGCCCCWWCWWCCWWHDGEASLMACSRCNQTMSSVLCRCWAFHVTRYPAAVHACRLRVVTRWHQLHTRLAVTAPRGWSNWPAPRTAPCSRRPLARAEPRSSLQITKL